MPIKREVALEGEAALREAQSSSFPLWRTMAVVAGIALCCVLALPWDAPVWTWMRSGHTEVGLLLASKWSHYTQWQWLMLPCLAGAVLSWKLKRADWMKLIVCVMIASAIAGLSAAALRGLTGRVRPKVTAVAPGWYGPWHNDRLVSTKWDYNSFPSGHVTVATSIVAAVFLRRPKIGFLLLWLPFSVGAARMYLGAHHLSDVLAGFALGTLLTAWVSGVFRRRWEGVLFRSA